MSTLIEIPRQPLTYLRWQWVLLLAVCVASLGLVYSLLRTAWDADHARQWLFQSAAFSIFPLWISYRGLAANHRKGESGLLPTLGAGNLLSITRGLFIAWLAGFLFLPHPDGPLGWFPGILFSLMILADCFDGYLARIHDHATLLGQQLDMSFDGIAVLVGSLLLVQYGQTPAWFVLVGLARYLFLMGSWLRRSKGLPIYDLAENPVRRQLAGSQMGFIAVVLFPAFSPPGTHLAAALFALPFLAGFLLDWLAVVGRRVNMPQWNRSAWLPVGLRVVVATLVIVWLSQVFSVGTSLTAFLGTAPAAWMLVLAIAGAALVAFGAAGRLAALGVLFSIGISQQLGELGATQLWLIVAATAIFYLGTGPYSLWVPEKTVLIRRPGEK